MLVFGKIRFINIAICCNGVISNIEESDACVGEVRHSRCETKNSGTSAKTSLYPE